MLFEILNENHEKTYYVNNDVIVTKIFYNIQNEKSNNNFTINVNHVDIKIICFSKRFFICQNYTNVFDLNNELHCYLERYKIKNFLIKIQEI